MYIHPTSALYKKNKEFVVYQNIHETSRPYMKGRKATEIRNNHQAFRVVCYHSVRYFMCFISNNNKIEFLKHISLCRYKLSARLFVLTVILL